MSVSSMAGHVTQQIALCGVISRYCSTGGCTKLLILQLSKYLAKCAIGNAQVYASMHTLAGQYH